MEWTSIYTGNFVEVFRVTPRIYYRKGNLKIRKQCNGAYFVGDNGVVVVDTPPNGIEMVEEANQLFGKPIRNILLTHGHIDHCLGLPDFYDLDVNIFCARRLFEYLMPDLGCCKATFIGVDGKMPLYLSGGLEVELFTFPDVTHSKWDMFIRLPEEGILVTGDAVVEYQTAYYHSADISLWISALRQLEKQEGKYLMTGHADGLYDYSYIHDFADFLTVVERAAKACFQLYKKGSKMIDRERFIDISPEKAQELVKNFFTEKSDDALYIEQRAGSDSIREVRMVLWEMIREALQ
jgi:glyoxylase-like metal-dependent hydrolase (beta-lactamase superfamily II)